jgi:hypothetical protein
VRSGPVYYFQLEEPDGTVLQSFVGVDLRLVDSAANLLLLRTFGDADAAGDFFREMSPQFKPRRLRFCVA